MLLMNDDFLFLPLRISTVVSVVKLACSSQVDHMECPPLFAIRLPLRGASSVSSATVVTCLWSPYGI